MNVSMEIKKQEAINRMKALKLFGPCIKAFKDRDEVQFSEVTGALYEFSDNKELTSEVRKFERENNALVYHVIHSMTSFGELYSFLYVSDHIDEWEMDHEDLKDNYVLSYVWNKDVPEYSEFGTIVVQQVIGGLVRIG